MKNEIYITENDYERLVELTKGAGNSKDRDYFINLRGEIKKAKVVSPEHILGNVVTMNSKVKLQDLDTREEFVFQIVFPSEANIDEGKISVLAPIGTALLGYKVGDAVRWRVPYGIKKLKIKEMLYQPESEGEWYS
ncbi:MAG: nucleoside diphosphate kinase regulator [Phycisphaerales bacterium]